jgi:hypothetical protein
LCLASRPSTLKRLDGLINDCGIIVGIKSRGRNSVRKSTTSRQRNQVDYQRRYRRQQTSLRKPSRDDVARVALHWIINEALKRDKEGQLCKWTELIVKHLVDQGFDRDAARRRIHELIERYEDGWGFQRKPHLTPHQDD